MARKIPVPDRPRPSRRRCAALLALPLVAGCGPHAKAHALTLERTIPLPSVSGRIDHLALDLKRRRLFVAELGQGAVEEIDLASGRRLGRISGLKAPQGLAFLPDLDELAVATGGDGYVRFYRGADLAPLGSLEAGEDADNLRVTDRGGLVVGSDALKLIDPKTRAVIKTAALPAHPEGFRLDGERFFVNLPRAGRIVSGDLDTGVAMSWKAAHGMNFPMAYEPRSGRLAVVFRAPARLVVMDSRTGKALSDRQTCRDSDDVFFDGARRRIYVSCGAGSVDVFPGDGGKRLERVTSRPGARTSLFSPELDRLYVAARATLIQGAAIFVYRPG